MIHWILNIFWHENIAWLDTFFIIVKSKIKIVYCIDQRFLELVSANFVPFLGKWYYTYLDQGWLINLALHTVFDFTAVKKDIMLGMHNQPTNIFVCKYSILKSKVRVENKNLHMISTILKMLSSEQSITDVR